MHAGRALGLARYQSRLLIAVLSHRQHFRDYLVRLDLENFERAPKVLYWPATQEASETCTRKGQPADQCRNYIKVLLEGTASADRKDQIFVCGTNAFTPECSWRRLSSISEVVEDGIDGKTTSPYSMAWNTTSLITREGTNTLSLSSKRHFDLILFCLNLLHFIRRTLLWRAFGIPRNRSDHYSQLQDAPDAQDR